MRRVGILGATGTVGQRFVQFLQGHPQFQITSLAASDRSAGKPYSEACAWKLPGTIPENVRDIVVQPIEPPLDGFRRVRFRTIRSQCSERRRVEVILEMQRHVGGENDGLRGV